MVVPSLILQSIYDQASAPNYIFPLPPQIPESNPNSKKIRKILAQTKFSVSDEDFLRRAGAHWFFLCVASGKSPSMYFRMKQKGNERAEGRREKGEGRREKGEGRREEGGGRREKREERGEKETYLHKWEYIKQYKKSAAPPKYWQHT
jgi:hypothetical protein